MIDQQPRREKPVRRARRVPGGYSSIEQQGFKAPAGKPCPYPAGSTAAAEWRTGQARRAWGLV